MIGFPKNSRFVCKPNYELARQRANSQCEICQKAGREVHHWWRTRGAGGGDYQENMVCLCGYHHALAHSNSVINDRLAVYVAMREGLTTDELEERLQALHRGVRRQYDDD